MSAEGRLHAFWLDRRADPVNNILFHGYHTSTVDGVTWEVDTQVSDEPFDLNLFFPPPPGYNAAGDYWGLDTVGNIVMAAWNTTVEVSQDIYVSRGIYSGTVSLSGYVSDALTAAPITGAQVSLDTGQAATTDSSGYYTMTLETGVYTVTVQAQDYYSATLTDLLLVMDTVQDFSLQPLPVNLSGQVVNALSLEPISAAQVSLDSGQAAFTDPDGFYTLTITPGIYTVTAQAAGFFSQTVSGLEAFSDTVQDFSLQPLPVGLSGQVVDALTLVPISGAEVLADSESALSGPDGTYHLELTPGVYTVTAQAGDYYSQTISALSVLTDTIQDFALQPVACPPPEILGLGYTAEGLTVTFTATVTSTLPLEYGWDFGDGLTSTLPGPVHNYAGYGDYQVTLDVQNACGSASGSLELALGRRSYLPIMTRP